MIRNSSAFISIKDYMIFKDFNIDKTTHIRTGYVDLWVKKTGRECFLNIIRSKTPLDPVVEISEPEEDSGWTRIITDSPSGTLTVQPAVPDRAVVVQSPDEIIIPVKQSAVFFIEIPLVLRLKIKSNPDILINDIPTGFFSNTWYGDFAEGILAYSSNTIISSEILKDIPPSSAVARITVSNKSNSPVKFRKIAVYAQNLNIYSSADNMLWTDNSSITFSNNNEIKISIDKKPQEGKKTLFFNEKYSQEKNIIKKSFTVIMKSVTGE